MKFNAHIGLLITMLAAAVVQAQAPADRKPAGRRRAAPPVSAKTPDVTLCDLALNPSAYRNNVVRLRTIYVSGYHGASFHDGACADPPASVWPSISCRGERDRRCHQINKELDAILEGKLRGNKRWPGGRAGVVLLGRLVRVQPRVKLRDGSVIIRQEPYPDYDFEIIKPLEAYLTPDEDP